MKKRSFRKLTAVMMAAILCFACSGLSAFAALPEENVVSPANIAITSTANLLEIYSGNTLTVFGKTSVQYGYKSEVIVELQRHNGSWGTVYTFSDTGNTSAVVDTTQTVASGYDYRLKLTHIAYDSNWNEIETITKYSDVVEL